MADATTALEGTSPEEQALAKLTPEERLKRYAVTAATAIAQSGRITAALEIARASNGLVIADDNARVAANDSGNAVAAAVKFLDEEWNRAKAPLEAAIADGRAKLVEIRVTLTSGRMNYDQAMLAYNAVQRRAAATAEAERQRLAREAEAAAEAKRREVEQQRNEAALSGDVAIPESLIEEDDVPPPMEEAPISAPPALIRTGAGSSTEAKRLTCELVDAKLADPAWLKLVGTTAPIADFERALRMEQVKAPGIGVDEHVAWKGLKIYYKPSISRSVTR